MPQVRTPFQRENNMNIHPDNEDLTELNPETWDNGTAPDSPIDAWCCTVCRRACGFVTDEYAEDGEDPILWMPTYESKSTGYLYCYEHGPVDVDQLANAFRQVNITLPYGDLNFLRAFLLTTMATARHRLADPDYLSFSPEYRNDAEARYLQMKSIAHAIDLVMDNRLI